MITVNGDFVATLQWRGFLSLDFRFFYVEVWDLIKHLKSGDFFNSQFLIDFAQGA